MGLLTGGSGVEWSMEPEVVVSSPPSSGARFQEPKLLVGGGCVSLPLGPDDSTLKAVLSLPRHSLQDTPYLSQGIETGPSLRVSVPSEGPLRVSRPGVGLVGARSFRTSPLSGTDTSRGRGVEGRRVDEVDIRLTSQTPV